MSFFGEAIPLYYPRYISIRKGENNYYESDKYDGNGTATNPETSGIVIFGATGDLCKRKLIPALFELWKKDLLPDNFLITGSARREPTVQQWKESLGDYPQEFLHHLDYQCADLDNVDSLHNLPKYLDDITYFLSVPPERYENAIVNLKEAGLLEDPDRSRVVIEKPFGYDYKSAHHLSTVVARHLREKQVYRIDHYLGKDTVSNILATRFAIFFWNHFGIVST